MGVATTLISSGRKKLLAQFGVAWAIAFAAILGVVSGIAQLLPAIETVPHSSLGALMMSAVVAAVHAWRRAVPEPLPAGDLLPETLSTSPPYCLECSTDRSALLSVHAMAEEVYPGVAPLPTDRYEQWLIRNENIFVCLFDHTREVRGYFDVFPLREDFMSLFVEGVVGEQDIRREHLLIPSEARTTQRLYLGGLAVRDWHRFEGKRCAAILLWGLIKYFDQFFPSPPNRTLYAHAVTKQGEDLLKRFRFQLVSEPANRKEPYRLYAADVDQQFRNVVRSNIPDYAGMVTLSWKTRRVLRVAGGRVA